MCPEEHHGGVGVVKVGAEHDLAVLIGRAYGHVSTAVRDLGRAGRLVVPGRGLGRGGGIAGTDRSRISVGSDMVGSYRLAVTCRVLPCRSFIGAFGRTAARSPA